MGKKTKRPLVSVIMPIYNGGRFLRLAIESIQNQTLQDFELICIDDRSTDGTYEVMRDYAKEDIRVKVFRNPTKQYLAGSLNWALKLARGKYIARMDADDISLPQRLEKQVALLKKNSCLGAVGGQIEVIDEHNQVLGLKEFPVKPKDCYQMIMTMMAIQPPVLMARASIFKKVIYDTGIAKHDDIDTHFQLLKHGSFSNVDDIIFQYRKLSTSYTFSDAKSVYFMALRIRLRALFKYSYRPSFLTLLTSAIETFVVLILPAKTVVALFELMRLQSKESIIIPAATTATAE
ncbi:MAG: glycosyltransferase family 2 protein [bacterium]|nr:glycosyltransferase family 2 protein [bacterium]